MNFDIKYFIEILIIGTANHLSVLDLKLNRKQKNLLRISLNVELEKDFRLQTKTPTELVNKFINDEFELDLKLTPSDLGEKARDQMIMWGISKAKNYDR